MIPFEYRLVVAFGDTDPAGIVYTPRFSHFCMEAAEVWFREVADFDWYHITTVLGMGTPVVHMEMNFIAPLRGGDQLAVEIRVEKLGRSSIALAFSGSKGELRELVFTGKIIFCCVEQGRGAIPVPPAQRQKIEAFMVTGS